MSSPDILSWGADHHGSLSLQAAAWKPETQKPIFMFSSKLILRIKYQCLGQPTVSERWLLDSKQVLFSSLSVVSVHMYEKGQKARFGAKVRKCSVDTNE